MELPASLDLLVKAFAQLPGIGRRSAQRLALHAAQHPEQANKIFDALEQVRTHLRHCDLCRSLCEDTLCHVCQNPVRHNGLLCIVERQSDVWAFERVGTYRGLYHVLGGALSPLDGIGPDQLGIPQLVERCKLGQIEEIILATGSSSEGESTAHYLDHVLRPTGVKITRLARGVPLGTELEYLDEGTLRRALEARTHT
jgi:recombination protein RecR